MGRLIDEDDVISAIDKRIEFLQTHEAFKRKHGDIDLLGLVPMIKAIKTAQPKTGKWLYKSGMGWGETWICSECGEKTTSTVMGKPRYKFCPMCGARMEGTE